MASGAEPLLAGSGSMPGAGLAFPVVRSARKEVQVTEDVPSVGGALLYYLVRPLAGVPVLVAAPNNPRGGEACAGPLGRFCAPARVRSRYRRFMGFSSRLDKLEPATPPAAAVAALRLLTASAPAAADALSGAGHRSRLLPLLRRHAAD
jgi:hypothetical protein